MTGSSIGRREQKKDDETKKNQHTWKEHLIANTGLYSNPIYKSLFNKFIDDFTDVWTRWKWILGSLARWCLRKIRWTRAVRPQPTVAPRKKTWTFLLLETLLLLCNFFSLLFRHFFLPYDSIEFNQLAAIDSRLLLFSASFNFRRAPGVAWNPTLGAIHLHLIGNISEINYKQ